MLPRRGWRIRRRQGGKQVGVAECLLQGLLRRANKHKIAFLMTEGVVDRFQIIHIAEKQQNIQMIALCELQLVRGGGQESSAIKESGQIVGNGKRADLAIEQGFFNSPYGSSFQSVMDGCGISFLDLTMSERSSSARRI